MKNIVTTKTKTQKGILSLSLKLFLFSALVFSLSAQAAEFNVDTTIDAVDNIPGDGLCEIAEGGCSLRAAVMEANANPGADVIRLAEAQYDLTRTATVCGETATNPATNDSCGDLDIFSDIEIIGEGPYRTIINASAIAVTGLHNNGHFDVKAPQGPGVTDFGLKNVFLENAENDGNGGSIRASRSNMTIDTVVFKDNGSRIAGGAVHIFEGVTTIRESHFFSNHLSGDASTHEGGGAIFNRNINEKATFTLTIEDSTFRSNRTSIPGTNGQTEANDPSGGAIHLGENAYAFLYQVTLYQNWAAGQGGAIYVDGLADVAFIRGSTISRNVADRDDDAGSAFGGGGLAVNQDDGDPVVQVINSIIAFNEEGITSSTEFSPDCMGEFQMDFSLLGNTANCGFTGSDNLLNQDPMLWPLGDSGGWVPTLALREGSPAIDKGSNIRCGSNDARGLFRKLNLVCDMGAWEFGHQPTFRPKISADGNSTGSALDDGSCRGLQFRDILVCTLRAAILESNGLSKPSALILLSGHEFDLDIPGSDEELASTGDLDIRSAGRIAIAGTGAQTSAIDASSLGDRIFHLSPLPDDEAELWIQDVTLSGGHPVNQAGGNILVIRGELRLTRTIVQNGTAIRGGGLAVSAAAEPAVVDIFESTFTGNHAENGTPGGEGGGLYVFGIANTAMEHSTVSGNTSDYHGGGIFASHSNTFIDLDYVTIHDNHADDDGSGDGWAGGIYNDSGTANVNVSNTAISGNTEKSGLTDDCHFSDLNSLGFNFSSTGNCGLDEPSDQNGTTNEPLDPMFGVLGDFGGGTPTLLPSPGSPLIDAANPSGCGGEDQRGEPRPIGDGCDIGAVEAPPFVIDEIFSDGFES